MTSKSFNQNGEAARLKKQLKISEKMLQAERNHVQEL